MVADAAPSPSPSSRPDGRLALVLVVLADLLPLAGVLVADWTPLTLLVLYWVEMGVVGLWAAVAALFAEHRSTWSDYRLPLPELRAKRGGVRLWPGGPPAYVRNVPFALSTLGVLAFNWLGFGLLYAIELDLPASLGPGQRSTLLLAGLAGFVGRGVEFHTRYVGDREYEHRSARTAVRAPARHVLVLVVLTPLVAATDTTPGAGVLAVAAIVAGKLAVDVYGYRTDHTDRDEPGRLGLWLDHLLGPGETDGPLAPITLPAGDPDARVTPDRRAVLVRGLLPAATALATRAGLLAVLAAVLAGLVFGPPGAALALVPVGLVVLVKLGAQYVTYAPLEYRRYGEELVAYDRWLGEPQWRVHTGSVRSADVAGRVVARLTGAHALAVSWFEGSDTRRERLGPFVDVGDAADRLGLPSGDRSFREPDRTVAVAAVALCLSLLAVPAMLVLSDAVETGLAVVLTLLLAPFVLLTFGSLAWVVAANL